MPRHAESQPADVIGGDTPRASGRNGRGAGPCGSGAPVWTKGWDEAYGRDARKGAGDGVALRVGMVRGTDSEAGEAFTLPSRLARALADHIRSPGFVHNCLRGAPAHGGTSPGLCTGPAMPPPRRPAPCGHRCLPPVRPLPSIQRPSDLSSTTSNALVPRQAGTGPTPTRAALLLEDVPEVGRRFAWARTILAAWNGGRNRGVGTAPRPPQRTGRCHGETNDDSCGAQAGAAAEPSPISSSSSLR